MAMTVKLTKGATILRLPAPSPGAVTKLVKEQATGLSAAGERYVYDKGVAQSTLALRFERLTTAEKDALLAFFGAAANGMVESFGYTDEHGQTRTARFGSPELAVRQVREEEWAAEILLEMP